MGHLSILEQIALAIIPLLFAITIHEMAHGWAASKLGDKTAWMLGRVSLNPIKHVDFIGTLFIPFILIAFKSPVIFGWAKPVPINPRNFKNPRRDMALTAAAGPLSNLLMAILWAIAAKIGIVLLQAGMGFGVALLLMGRAGIWINLVLMFLNLIPLPPLDGGRILVGLLPRSLAIKYARIEPYGFFILLFLVIIGILNFLMIPVAGVERLLGAIFGLF